MIRLENLHKAFHYRGTVKHVARGVTITFPRGKSIGLLGRNGAGKSTLLNMLAGSIAPDQGQIVIEGTVSWPVGFQGSFHRDLTGAQNTRFLARVYGVDTDEMMHFVEEFAELGNHFHQPVRTYSSGMRSRLGFGCSMAIRFDWYLVDEVTAVGDAAFKSKSTALFRDRMRHSSAVFVSHSLNDIRNTCDAAVVLENGSMRYYRDLEEGIAQHERNMRRAPPG
ncbi:ABC transporter ATP-binding protein [Rhodobacteraceae bacterium D3-12]|nr:ABC transporter ATP-binding protein [Rhodobacteraceae bacterium D3-12]